MRSAQGRFAAMHDALLARPEGVERSTYLKVAMTAGLDAEEFQGCMVREMKPSFEQDAVKARNLGIRGTPTFHFGYVLPDQTIKVTGRLSGARPLAEFERLLDSLLKRTAGY